MCINPPPPSLKKQTAVLIFLLMTSKVTNPLKLDSNSSVKMMHLNEADTTNLTRSDKMSIRGWEEWLDLTEQEVNVANFRVRKEMWIIISVTSLRKTWLSHSLTRWTFPISDLLSFQGLQVNVHFAAAATLQTKKKPYLSLTFNTKHLRQKIGIHKKDRPSNVQQRYWSHYNTVTTGFFQHSYINSTI